MALIRKTDFMCVCSDESRAEAEACYARVLEDCPHEDFLTRVAVNLEWGLGDHEDGQRFRGQIDSIYFDQWGAVSVEVLRYEPAEQKYVGHAHIFVQCDLVHHGLARAYELAVESVKETADET